MNPSVISPTLKIWSVRGIQTVEVEDLFSIFNAAIFSVAVAVYRVSPGVIPLVFGNLTYTFLEDTKDTLPCSQVAVC